MINNAAGSGPHILPLARKYPQELNNLNAVSMIFDNATHKLFVLDHQVIISGEDFDRRRFWKFTNSSQRLYSAKIKVPVAKGKYHFTYIAKVIIRRGWVH